jgi:hypothetical protein
MNARARLAKLEQAGSIGEDWIEVERTPEERQVEMLTWLHLDQIHHDVVGRDRALAHAMALHQDSVRRPRHSAPPPPEVDEEITRRLAEHRAERAALPPEERAELERRAEVHEALAAAILAEAVTELQREADQQGAGS